MEPLKEKRLVVYPHRDALAIVGGSSPACNRAIECWARILRETEASLAESLKREEWNFFADVMNGTIFDDSWSGQYLWAEAEDAMRLNGTDWKWFGTEKEELKQSLAHVQKKKTELHPRGKTLLAALGKFTFAQTQFVLFAVSFFWQNHEQIEPQKDDWWTLGFRVRFQQKKS